MANLLKKFDFTVEGFKKDFPVGAKGNYLGVKFTLTGNGHWESNKRFFFSFPDPQYVFEVELSYFDKDGILRAVSVSDMDAIYRLVKIEA